MAPQDCETLEAEFPKELIVIEEMIVVVGGIFLFLPNSPFEKLLTKSAGAILIVCAQVSYTECTGNAFNTEAVVASPCAVGGSVRVLDRNMKTPVRRNASRLRLWTQRVHRCHIASVDLKRHIKVVRPHRELADGPAEKF